MCSRCPLGTRKNSIVVREQNKENYTCTSGKFILFNKAVTKTRFKDLLKHVYPVITSFSFLRNKGNADLISEESHS